MISGKISTSGKIWRTATVEIKTDKNENKQNARLSNINVYYIVSGSDIVNTVVKDVSSDANEYKINFGIPDKEIKIYWSAQERIYKKTTGKGTNYDNYFFKNYTGSGAINGQNYTGANTSITAKKDYFISHDGYYTRQLNLSVGNITTDLTKWYSAKFVKDSKGNIIKKVYQTSQPESTFLVIDFFDNGNGRIIVARDTNKNNMIRCKAFYKDNDGCYSKQGLYLEVATASGGGNSLEIKIKWYISKKTAMISEVDPGDNPDDKLTAKFTDEPSHLQIVLYNNANLTDPVETIDTVSYSWVIDNITYSGDKTILQFQNDDDEETNNLDANGQPLSPNDPNYKTSYAYIINVNQFGIRFKQYADDTNIKKEVKRQINTNVKILYTENNPLPEYYDPLPNFTTEEPIDLTVFTSSTVKANRLRILSKLKLIYLYIPTSWGLKIENGFYTYTSYSYNADKGDFIFNMNFKGLQKVNATGIPENPSDWNYQNLANFSANFNAEGDAVINYKTLLQIWANYKDLSENF